MPIKVQLTIIQDLESLEDAQVIGRQLAMLFEAKGATVTTEVKPPDIWANQIARTTAKPVAPAAGGKAAPKATSSGGKATTAKGNGSVAKAEPEPDLADTDDAQGPVDPDDDDALGLAPPSMTENEAKELGLGKIREIYARGHRAEVKELQQKLGIGKFTDIPDKDGHKLLKLVVAIEEKLGMRV